MPSRFVLTSPTSQNCVPRVLPCGVLLFLLGACAGDGETTPPRAATAPASEQAQTAQPAAAEAPPSDEATEPVTRPEPSPGEAPDTEDSDQDATDTEDSDQDATDWGPEWNAAFEVAREHLEVESLVRANPLSIDGTTFPHFIEVVTGTRYRQMLVSEGSVVETGAGGLAQALRANGYPDIEISPFMMLSLVAHQGLLPEDWHFFSPPRSTQNAERFFRSRSQLHDPNVAPVELHRRGRGMELVVRRMVTPQSHRPGAPRGLSNGGGMTPAEETILRVRFDRRGNARVIAPR